MLESKQKLSWWLVAAYSIVPFLVSIWSTIHVVSFFTLTNPSWLAIGLALSFEIGALAALAGLVAIDKINKNIVWFIFIILTAFQCVGNTYHAFDQLTNHIKTNPYWIQNFTELFALEDSELPFVKRIIAIMSGAILPIVSLCFLDILINYIMVTLGFKEPYGKRKKATETTQVISSSISEPTTNTPVDVEPIIEPVIEVKNETPVEEETVVPEIKDEPVLPVVEEDTATIPEEEEVEEPAHYEEDFEKFVQDKRKRLDEMREPNLELLDIFYNNGKILPGEELPNYSEFLKKVDIKKFPQKEINFFLTLCNYLEIFRLSGTQKIALKTYDEAKAILSNYLSIGDGE